jgi:hypothetical protein
MRVGAAAMAKAYVGATEADKMYVGAGLAYNRSTEWTPASLPSIQLWVDAEAEAARRGLSILDTEEVTQWNDLSGFNRHVVVATGLLGPSIAYSDRWSVRWDGTMYPLSSSESIAYRGPFTVIVAMTPPSTSYLNSSFASTSSDTIANGFHITGSTTSHRFHHRTDGGASITGNNIIGNRSSGELCLLTARANGTDQVQVWKNATEGAITQGTTTKGYFGSMIVGGARNSVTSLSSRPWVYGVVVCFHALSDETLAQTWAWLNERHSLGLIL